ncbi:BCCT family transporter [Halobellus captivus]|uniref:BCCT family transporter n=1 Tax=Halobellus captivus TaxID=2592614 RepID=UPI00119FB61C|nr:BCCT family transporter [Halobellus captivus]
MGARDGAEPARMLPNALLATFVGAGSVVLVGFFFPSVVDNVLGGRAWLVVSLLFFGSGLGYLAALPYEGLGTETSTASTLLHVRRGSLLNHLSDVMKSHDPVILGLPVVVFSLYFALQIVFPAGTTAAVGSLTETVLSGFGPLLVATVLLAVGFCVFLFGSSWGDIRLGGDVEPTYTLPTYFALVFTAGIAAGIVFWGPAEALFHYQTPPPLFDVTPQSGAAVDVALRYTLFHWGLSAWSAYAVIGIPLAYFVFERDAPLRISSILTPFVGVDNLDSYWSRALDTLAVFATIGGIATSIALVSQQFLTGVEFQWGVSSGPFAPVLFVGGLAAVYVLSAVSGLHRGIRRIAGTCVVLFAVFALLLFAVGPKSFVVERGTTALGSYVIHFIPMSLVSSGSWAASWTVWNWAWWFSWAPFAGTFLAALSRGRRIRTVVLTTVAATSAATSVWFLVVGGSTLSMQHSGRVDILSAIEARGGSEAVAGFPLLSALPLGDLLIFLFFALIVAFIVTSADTSTLIAAILASRRGIAPSRGSIALWGAFQAAVALAVILIGGGETLQALAVLTGAPFAVLALVAMIGLALACIREERGGEHTSLVRHVLNRLPSVQLHHDFDPPDREK